jgi:hypothetical protein
VLTSVSCHVAACCVRRPPTWRRMGHVESNQRLQPSGLFAGHRREALDPSHHGCLVTIRTASEIALGPAKDGQADQQPVAGHGSRRCGKFWLCHCSWIVRTVFGVGQALARSLDRKNVSKFVRSATRIARRGRREHGSSRSGTEGTRPHSVPDEVWAEAVRRRAVVAPLAGQGRLTCSRMHNAPRELGLNMPGADRLLALYREVPVTASFSRASRSTYHQEHHPG